MIRQLHYLKETRFHLACVIQYKGSLQSMWSRDRSTQLPVMDGQLGLPLVIAEIKVNLFVAWDFIRNIR